MCAQSLQSCPTLSDLMDRSPPGSSVRGIFLARTLEWVAMACSRGSSWPKDGTHVSCIAGRWFTTKPLGNPRIICINIQACCSILNTNAKTPSFDSTFLSNYCPISFFPFEAQPQHKRCLYSVDPALPFSLQPFLVPPIPKHHYVGGHW